MKILAQSTDGVDVLVGAILGECPNAAARKLEELDAKLFCELANETWSGKRRFAADRRDWRTILTLAGAAACRRAPHLGHLGSLLPFLERSDFATLALSVYLRFLSRNKRPIAKSSSASGHPSVSMECMKKPFRGVGRRLNGKGIAKQPNLGASQRSLVA